MPFLPSPSHPYQFYVAIANADLTYRIMGQRTLSDYFMTMAALQTHWLDAPDEVPHYTYLE